jgi:surfeit locus 1 family protein
MRLNIGNRVFAPRLWAALLTTAALACFVGLGWWQLDRAREKQAMLDSFARGTLASVALGDATVDGLPRYQHVTVQGRYDPAHQVLLDNMPSSTGQPGYRVLTPFVRPGSRRLLLVDRGWVPLGASRALLPRVDVAGNARETGGRLDQLPVPGLRVGPAAAPGSRGWPWVLNFPTRADLEQALGQPVESRIVLLDAARPDGYERVWRPSLGFPPERHLGYAVQWFALAIVAVVAFVALSMQGASPAGTSPE